MYNGAKISARVEKMYKLYYVTIFVNDILHSALSLDTEEMCDELARRINETNDVRVDIVVNTGKVVGVAISL